MTKDKLDSLNLALNEAHSALQWWEAQDKMTPACVEEALNHISDAMSILRSPDEPAASEIEQLRAENAQLKYDLQMARGPIGPLCLNHDGYSGLSKDCPTCSAENRGESQ